MHQEDGKNSVDRTNIRRGHLYDATSSDSSDRKEDLIWKSWTKTKIKVERKTTIIWRRLRRRAVIVLLLRSMINGKWQHTATASCGYVSSIAPVAFHWNKSPCCSLLSHWHALQQTRCRLPSQLMEHPPLTLPPTSSLSCHSSHASRALMAWSSMSLPLCLC